MKHQNKIVSQANSPVCKASVLRLTNDEFEHLLNPFLMDCNLILACQGFSLNFQNLKSSGCRTEKILFEYRKIKFTKFQGFFQQFETLKNFKLLILKK